MDEQCGKNPFDNRDAVQANRTHYANAAEHFHSTSRIRPCMEAHLTESVLSHFGQTRPRTVVDIGTGTAFALEVMDRYCGRGETHYLGLDVSEEMLRIAQQQRNAFPFCLFDGVHLPLEDQSVDLVLLVSVLHHLADPKPLLREAARILAPGGLLLALQEPNPTVNGALLRIRRALHLLPDEETMRAEFHQFMTTGLDPADLLSLLKEEGLSPRRTYTNAALLDELCARAGPWIRLPLWPLSKLSHRCASLSFTIAAVR